MRSVRDVTNRCAVTVASRRKRRRRCGIVPRVSSRGGIANQRFPFGDKDLGLRSGFALEDIAGQSQGLYTFALVAPH